MERPLCSNAYDDVTDFEICGFKKTTTTTNKEKTRYLENETEARKNIINL